MHSIALLTTRSCSTRPAPQHSQSNTQTTPCQFPYQTNLQHSKHHIYHHPHLTSNFSTAKPPSKTLPIYQFSTEVLHIQNSNRYFPNKTHACNRLQKMPKLNHQITAHSTTHPTFPYIYPLATHILPCNPHPNAPTNPSSANPYPGQFTGGTFNHTRTESRHIAHNKIYIINLIEGGALKLSHSIVSIQIYPKFQSNAFLDGCLGGQRGEGAL